MRRLLSITGWLMMTVFLGTCMFMMCSINVHAYIDPSAVTYVIQAVAGVLIAIGACLTIFRHKIIAFFRKGKDKEEKREVHFNEENTDDSLDERSEDVD